MCTLTKRLLDTLSLSLTPPFLTLFVTLIMLIKSHLADFSHLLLRTYGKLCFKFVYKDQVLPKPSCEYYFHKFALILTSLLSIKTKHNPLYNYIETEK